MKQIAKPIEDKILLKKIDSPDTTAHGVIMPDIAQEGANMGEVVAIGPGRLLMDGRFSPNQCQVGDKVLYLKFEAYKVDVNDEELVVVRESNVLLRLYQSEDININIKPDPILNDKQEYLGSGTLIRKSINKYGRENFEKISKPDKWEYKNERKK